MAELFERSSDVALNFSDEGQGKPILLIHGVGSDLGSWDGVIERLSSDRRYIRFDLRGHGQSRCTPTPYGLDDFVEDAIALLDHLKIQNFSIVGFSLGGLIAQAIALAHPNRVETLSLVSTIAGRTKDEEQRVQERAKTLESEGAVAHLSKAVDRWFTDDFARQHPEILEARRAKSLQNDPGSYVAGYRVLADNDLGEKLNQIKMPTLVMTGENDVGSSPRMARLIHEKIDGSHLHILPLLRHSVLLEAPDQVATLIEPFLATNVDSSRTNQ